MTEYVGRTGSKRVYSYPERPRGSDLTLLARNFATGPKIGTLISTGIAIPWNAVDAGTPPTTADVPITPRSSGIVLISGIVTFINGSGGPVNVVIFVQISDGINPPTILPVPANVGLTPLPDGGIITLPFLAETTPTDTPVGTTRYVEIFVTGDGAALAQEGSAVEVQEVPIATG